MQSDVGQVPGAQRGDQQASVPVDPTVTLGLLIAALDMQRRTSLALYRLMQGVSGPRRLAPRSRPERQPRCRSSQPAHQEPRAAVDAAARTIQPSAGVVAPVPVHPSTLQIRCFGRFEVLRDGVAIEHWRRGKAKTLLKYLVVRRQPVPRDILIDLLWPDSDPQVVVNGLRVTLHALRQALGTDGATGRAGREYVIFDGGNYGLNPSVDLWVDADEFSRHFAAGLRAERQRQVAAAIAHYEYAEEMYRDDYLLEDLYEDWTLVRREELKDQYLMVLTKLADACLLEAMPKAASYAVTKSSRKTPAAKMPTDG